MGVDKTNKARFKAWFIGKWGEWDKETGLRSTQQDLSVYLGISRSAVAHYTGGRKLPEGRNLKKIAQRWPDVYQFTEEQPDDPYAALPPEMAVRLRGAIREIELTLNEKGLEPSSSAALAISREIFSRFGFTVNETEISEDDR